MVTLVEVPDSNETLSVGCHQCHAFELKITSGGTGAFNFNLFKSKLLLRACLCGLEMEYID